jgi:small subunit ribosomal protein S16
VCRTARNSKPLEVIGTYDPIPRKDIYDTSGRLHKDIKLDITRAKYWIGVGAQPSDTAWRILSMVGCFQQQALILADWEWMLT